MLNDDLKQYIENQEKINLYLIKRLDEIHKYRKDAYKHNLQVMKVEIAIVIVMLLYMFFQGSF